jgi:hypothetical protein
MAEVEPHNGERRCSAKGDHEDLWCCPCPPSSLAKGRQGLRGRVTADLHEDTAGLLERGLPDQLPEVRGHAGNGSRASGART